MASLTATRPGASSAEHPNHLRPYVDTVIDHFQPTAGVRNEREHWPRRTMMYAGHPIEGVGQ